MNYTRDKLTSLNKISSWLQKAHVILLFIHNKIFYLWFTIKLIELIRIYLILFFLSFYIVCGICVSWTINHRLFENVSNIPNFSSPRTVVPMYVYIATGSAQKFIVVG